VVKEGAQATEGEIIEYVKTHIAKYKAPRMVEFVNSLPQGPTGKILKRELSQLSHSHQKALRKLSYKGSNAK
jgi:long-chain acyl-CoA synthetase